MCEHIFVVHIKSTVKYWYTGDTHMHMNPNSVCSGTEIALGMVSVRYLLYRSLLPWQLQQIIYCKGQE